MCTRSLLIGAALKRLLLSGESSITVQVLMRKIDRITVSTCNRHEIVGKAVRVGSKVKGIKVGDRVGVGAQINSCHECALCLSNNENYCAKLIHTYVRDRLLFFVDQYLLITSLRIEREVSGWCTYHGRLLYWNHRQ